MHTSLVSSPAAGIVSGSTSFGEMGGVASKGGEVSSASLGGVESFGKVSGGTHAVAVRLLRTQKLSGRAVMSVEKATVPF